MSEACNHTSPHRVIHVGHDNCDGRIEALRSAYPGGTVRYNYSGFLLSKLTRECRKTLIVARREAVFEHKVATMDQSVIAEAVGHCDAQSIIG